LLRADTATADVRHLSKILASGRWRRLGTMAVKQVILAGVSLGMVVILVQVANGQPINSGVLGSLDSSLGGLLDMGRLNASQITAVASQAGFQGDDLVTAVAVALAESGGNPSVVGDMNIPAVAAAGGSVGLWQINRHAHPEFSDWDLKNPSLNAAAAFSVYQNAGMSFTPWSTFTNGAYEAHLSAAQSAVSA